MIVLSSLQVSPQSGVFAGTAEPSDRATLSCSAQAAAAAQKEVKANSKLLGGLAARLWRGRPADTAGACDLEQGIRAELRCVGADIDAVVLAAPEWPKVRFPKMLLRLAHGHDTGSATASLVLRSSDQGCQAGRTSE